MKVRSQFSELLINCSLQLPLKEEDSLLVCWSAREASFVSGFVRFFAMVDDF